MQINLLAVAAEAPTMVGPIGWLFALPGAAAMGYAIARGSTCTVAAAEEMLRERRFTRIVALVEAALWVMAGLALAMLAGLMPARLPVYPVTSWTLIGAALLGLGAYVNRACTIGSIARIGAGQWHYLLTPLGILIGNVAAQPWRVSAPAPAPAHAGAMMLAGPSVVLLLLLLPFVLWRGSGMARAVARGRIAEHLDAPHHSTALIGIAFVVLALSAGAWTYTDALDELARGMSMNGLLRLALFAALLGGAILGGRTLGTERRGRWSFAGALACLAGGMLMGAGSVLIPGSNDRLILVGLPALDPHAWVAMAVMLLTIVACMLAGDALGRASVRR